tara:strand:+ start:244 stop:462 length:219 start_codon:yes stop_codon:yes gene_type:complete
MSYYVATDGEIMFDSYDSEYSNSVIECTDSEGNLSEPNVLKLLHDHGASYHDYAEDCGHDYHANTVLSWLGY